MAKKTEEKNLERTYNIPLRKEWLRVPKYKRAKKAVAGLRKFLVRHMKSENVLIGKYANLEIWKHGIKNPPHHILIKAVKDDKGVVKAELVGAPEEKNAEEKRPEIKKEEPKKEVSELEKTAEKEAIAALGEKAMGEEAKEQKKE